MKATKASLLLACCAIVFFCAAGTRLSLAADSGHRTTVSLNGQWDVADSVAPDAPFTGLHAQGAGARTYPLRYARLR
jgi:hypothetical protein